MTNDELNNIVGAELQEWGAAVLARLAQRLQQNKLVASGELLAGLQLDALRQTADGISALGVAFADSGRMVDGAAHSRAGQPPIEAIEKWIRSVGLSKFPYWPKMGMRVPTESLVVNRLAWGIALSKKRNNEYRPRKWFSKPFYATIDPLIDKLVTAYQARTGTVVGAAFTI